MPPEYVRAGGRRRPRDQKSRGPFCFPRGQGTESRLPGRTGFRRGIEVRRAGRTSPSFRGQLRISSTAANCPSGDQLADRRRARGPRRAEHLARPRRAWQRGQDRMRVYCRSVRAQQPEDGALWQPRRSTRRAPRSRRSAWPRPRLERRARRNRWRPSRRRPITRPGTTGQDVGRRKSLLRGDRHASSLEGIAVVRGQLNEGAFHALRHRGEENSGSNRACTTRTTAKRVSPSCSFNRVSASRASWEEDDCCAARHGSIASSPTTGEVSGKSSPSDASLRLDIVPRRPQHADGGARLRDAVLAASRWEPRGGPKLPGHLRLSNGLARRCSSGRSRRSYRSPDRRTGGPWAR